MGRKKNTVEQEILDLLETKRKRGEKEQTYLTRITKALSQIEEEEWDQLSNSAQDWYDEAAEAHNEGDEIPNFASAESDDEEDEEEDYDDEEDEEEDEDDDYDEDEDEDEDEEEDYDEDDEDDEEEEDYDDEEEEDDEEDEEEDYDDEEDEEEDEDDEDEDEEEDDDGDSDDEVSLELEDLSKGDYVTAETEDDEYTGEVKSTARNTLTLSVDGDTVKIKNDDLTWISEAEPPKKTRGRSKGKTTAKKEPKKTIAVLVMEVCVKFPGLSEEKVAARLEKAGHDINPSTLRGNYKKAHVMIDLMKAAGWSKAKK